jgi:hypothetical protein
MCLVIPSYILEGKQAKSEERKQAVLLYLADLISSPWTHCRGQQLPRQNVE